ncbi:MAG: SRPBCC family protein [Acidimicrobiales bacterium]
MHDEVTIHIAAPPDKVWGLVSDVTKIGRFSPETFEAQWIGGATGPAVGAQFRGHVKRNERGPTYWTTCTVTASEPGREFAFGVGPDKDRPLNTWGYRIEESGDGSDVTEWFRLRPVLPLRIYWALLGWARGKRNRNDMLRTLERMKAELESAERGSA